LKAGIRIALVDDDEAVRRAVKRLLQVSGLQVETFASGQEFLDALAPDRFDCVLLDLNMPQLSGLEVLKRMKARGIGVHAIMATAYDDPQMQEQCLAHGARTYLRKPLGGQRLLEAIAQAVDPGGPQEGAAGGL
jgi:FixJ family two-component response regulator